MKSKVFLKEKAVHGTALIPIDIHHLSYEPLAGDFFYLHWHAEFELIVVLEGAMVYTIEDQAYPLMAGEGLLIEPNQLHAARDYNGMPCEACVVLFHPNLFDDNQQGATFSKFIYPVLNGDLQLANYIQPFKNWQKTVLERLKDIDQFREGPIDDNELLLKSKLFEIWHLFYQNAVNAAPLGRDKKNYRLERMLPILDYIHTHYRDEITLTYLANMLPMSEGQFCRTFKEVKNMSPIAYVIRYRILQSCALLTETNTKIANIARTVGFSNISYFNREFIKAIGCSPSKYRKEKTFYLNSSCFSIGCKK